MSSAVAMEQTAQPVLGIVAASGALTRTIIAACRASGRPFFLLALEEATDGETTEEAGPDHAWIRIGAISKALDTLHAHGVTEIVLAGKVHRPKISSIRPDLKG